MTALGARTLLATAALALGVAGCGGTSDTTASAAQSETVDISNYKFQPETISVGTGAKVTFTNSDDTKHTATADDGSFDTGDLDQGDSTSVTLSKPGEFTYYCRYHPFMKATIDVQ
jgi:plastocyanin